MRVAWRLLLLVLVAVVYSLPVAIRAQFLPAGDRARFRARHQSRGSALLCRVFRMRVRASVPPDSGRPMLIVCNHFGVLDPFALASVMRVAFVGKAEIKRWPLFGWIARVYDVIFVYRERTHTVGAFVHRVQRRMRAGVPVLVFPEGTTCADETILPFKTGVFAAVTGMEDAAILPVYLKPVRIEGKTVDETNRHRVTWAGGNQPFLANLMGLLRLRQIEMEVRVGEPFVVGHMNRKELARESRNQVVALRDAPGAADTFRR